MKFVAYAGSRLGDSFRYLRRSVLSFLHQHPNGLRGILRSDCMRSSVGMVYTNSIEWYTI